MELFKYIYLAGIWSRNKKIFNCYNTLKECEGWSVEKLRALQLERLRELIANAYNNTLYYRNKFDACDFRASDLKTLDDLKLIPVTTKEELLENSGLIQLSANGEKLFFSETSGSTGRPLVFYRNQEWDAWHNASVLRGYSWHNIAPWERNGYLWGYNIAPEKRLKIRFLDMLQNRFRLFSYKDDAVDQFVQKLEHARYLGGYSSMIYEIAKKINARSLSGRFKLKMIKGTSEKIFDAYQDEVEKAFGRRMISEYGSAEAGIIAFECAHGNMHINMETVIVEVVDDEIVVTNLVSGSFPIIRYKLGDYVKISKKGQCPCGMAHPVIEEVTGRVGSVIYGNKASYPSLTLYYVFKNLALESGLILNYQVIQDVKGSVTACVESKLNYTGRKRLEREFVKYFGDDLDVRILDGHKNNDRSGKKKDFVSNIEVPGCNG